jgi:DMSO/TMAO reductase YedYZ molybdopterin-dependent catalytic subunit
VTPGRLDRLAPQPALVDWAILALVGLEVCSGLLSLTAGTPGWGWLFVGHSVGGVTLVGLLFWKFRRVRRRVTDLSLWDDGTPVSLALAALAVAALATGLVWTTVGVLRVGPWTLLTGHMILGLLVVPVVAWHLRYRFRLPNRRRVRGRREALRFTALAVAGTVAWRLEEAAVAALELAGADRRFTGSSDAADGSGNDFPVTMWLADDPDPVDVSAWRLEVTGEVRTPRSFAYGALTPDGNGGVDAREREQAVLDCTGGWYAERDWEGVRVGDLLEAVGTTDGAQWVSVRSVTEYRWSLPIEEARDALLATHVDGEPLTHGHGAPLRLVAPGRRGFQWVKWVDRVEVRPTADRSRWIAIFASGLDG